MKPRETFDKLAGGSREWEWRRATVALPPVLTKLDKLADGS